MRGYWEVYNGEFWGLCLLADLAENLIICGSFFHVEYAFKPKMTLKLVVFSPFCEVTFRFLGLFYDSKIAEFDIFCA